MKNLFMKNLFAIFSRNKGFTLVEMAIVLVIVGLLISAFIAPLSAQKDLKDYSETRQEIAIIKEAIIGYVLSNGRLPCPADATVASSTVGAGTQKFDATGTSCSFSVGVVPWVDLGISETDAWGRRYTYYVTARFSDAILLGTVSPPVSCNVVPPNSSFALCTEGAGTITDNTITVASKIPAVIVSHGKNGLGAYLPSGVKIPDASASAQEKANSDTDSNYISMIGNPNTFDDVVDWVSSNIVFNRMVTAGRLP